MNMYADPEKGILREAEAARTAHLSAQGGTFSLRRAHYFTKTGKPLLTSDQLSAEQQQELIRLIRDDNADARRKMIAHNIHLVIDFAKHYANCGLTPLELVREGNHGLIQSVERFEPEGGISFPAYATWCIRQHIERAIMKKNSPIQHVAKPPFAPHGAPSILPAVLSNKSATIGSCHGFHA